MSSGTRVDVFDLKRDIVGAGHGLWIGNSDSLRRAGVDKSASKVKLQIDLIINVSTTDKEV